MQCFMSNNRTIEIDKPIEVLTMPIERKDDGDLSLLQRSLARMYSNHHLMQPKVTNFILNPAGPYLI